MEWLKRRFWLLNFLTIGVCAMCCAWATSHLLEAKFLLDSGPRKAGPVKALATLAPSHTKDTDVILRRNVFCSTCPPLIDNSGPTDAGVPSSSDPVKTSLPLQLLTTLVSDDPHWSIAVIRETSNKQSGAFKLGSPISGAHVIDIQEKKVLFELADGRIEFLDFGGEAKAGEAVAAAPAEHPSGADDNKDLEAGIKKVSDNRFTIQRALLDKLLADPNALARSARIVPSVIDGKPSGFKLYAIRPGSLYDKIGLQNGDTVRAINGNEITSPDRALEIYTKLRSASHINVSVLRRGKDQTYDYTITG